jgi:DNA polymerase-3 subunit gamma/tau
MELYKKYRPKSLKTMIGNTDTIQSIRNMESFPHAILLSGESGTGKTTLGRIIAKMLKSKGLDFVELDTASFRGIDTIREIRKKMEYKPLSSDARVYLLDEVHMLGVGGASEKNAAQNALLKALEEAPDHLYFILCTTNPEMLLPTIRSRCTSFHLKTLNDDEMQKLIVRIIKKEKVTLSQEVIDELIQSADGRPRKALTILEKVIVLKDEQQQLLCAKETSLEEGQVKDLCYLLLKKGSWKKVSKELQKLKKEQPETIRRAVLGMMSSALLDGWGFKFQNDPGYVMSWFYDKSTYDSGFPGIVFCCYAITQGLEVY